MRKCLLLACSVAVAAPAGATVIVPADFETVVDESDAIVYGQVVDVRSAMTAPSRTIQSLITLRIIRSVKGSAGPTVTFRVPNGQVGRYRRVLVGAPEFEEGEEVVVFLRGHGPAIPHIFGLNQGVYRVLRDAAARAMVMPPRWAVPPGSVEPIIRGDPARRPMPVEAFVGEVQAVINATRQRGARRRER